MEILTGTWHQLEEIALFGVVKLEERKLEKTKQLTYDCSFSWHTKQFEALLRPLIGGTIKIKP